ncbi:MAG: EAL domain-containing protein [Bacteroidota bacterium]
MTLLRQLTLVIVTLFLLLFAGTFIISVHNTQQYLFAQLQTISQDTSTSLGLTLSPHFASDEMVIVESLTSAVFDSGYYREVIIRSTDGKPLIEHRAPVRIEGIPPWFIRLVPLETPHGEALIMDGWKQAGTITVAANPGEAYITLWKACVQSFWWFLAASLLTFSVGVMALRFILRPLRAVEAQARAISDREYPVQQKLPWTPELRSVVEAMNRMTMKIRDMFQEQADAMERIRAENFRDQVTGLANRKYFDTQLRHLISCAEAFHVGALVLLQIKDLKKINDAAGYVKTDALLAEVGSLIREHCASISGVDHFAAHIAGADFAIVLSEVTEKEVEEFAARLMNALPRLHDKGLIDSIDIAHAGIAIYHEQSFFDFLSDADTALRAAQAAGVNSWYVNDEAHRQGGYAHSASRWSEILQGIIRYRKIVLFSQPVMVAGAAGGIHHYEILPRVIDEDGNIIPAGIFIPQAKRLGLNQEFDKLVVQEVMSHLDLAQSGMPVAINLFPNSIANAAFNDWLVGELTRQPHLARRLVFEIAEYGAVENVGALRAWVDRIRATGAKTSIDHFGKAFTSFGYLCETRIDYLKIDGSFIRDLSQNKDHRFFVESIIKIAHGLDIAVVAESVENDADIAVLAALGIDGMQGYGLAAPTPWESV